MDFVRFIVIDGTMFGGKTEAMIGYGRRLQRAKKQVGVFRHVESIRPGEESELVSHTNAKLEGVQPIILQDEEEERVYAEGRQYDAVFVEEGHFLRPTIAEHLHRLFTEGHFVLYCGLRTDFQGKPFEPTLAVLGLAEAEHETHNAICMLCFRNQATRNLKLADGRAAMPDSKRLEAGSDEKYMAACLECFELAYTIARAQ